MKRKMHNRTTKDKLKKEEKKASETRVCLIGPNKRR